MLTRWWEGNEVGSSPRLRGTGQATCAVRMGPDTCGSSPRLRGTEVDTTLQRQHDRQRFIPAPAGNRVFPVDGNQVPCGRFIPAPAGNSCLSAKIRSRILAYGSSPRLRGTGDIILSDPKLRRFIPAPAGNRSWESGAGGFSAVHPRACGEQIWSQRSQSHCPGSSPRLRGTGPPARGIPHVKRFIPAPAGNRTHAQ